MRGLKKITEASAVALAFAAGACSPPPTPKSIKDAEAAFALAEKGVAAELAPAQLETAKQALDRASSQFEAEGEGQTTDDLAYIAARRVELATLEGEIEKANRDRAAASEERSELTEQRLSRAETELSEKEKQLGEEQVARSKAERRAAAALASLSEIAKVKEEKRGVVITLSGSVLFASGSHTLIPIAKDKLEDVARGLKEGGYGQIVVEGYTDSVGNDATNQRLSQERAEAVRQGLIDSGIEAGKITAVGKGEANPVATNRTPDGRANNRRVEIVIKPETE